MEFKKMHKHAQIAITSHQIKNKIKILLHSWVFQILKKYNSNQQQNTKISIRSEKQ